MDRAPDAGSSSPAEAARAGARPRWGRSALVGGCGTLVALSFSFALEVGRRAHLVAPDPTPILYDRNGAFIAELGRALKEGRAGAPLIDYGYWTIDPPERVARATLALEDRRFFVHPGVDPAAVVRALWRRWRFSGRGGASTLAMQIARMQQPATRSFAAKALEAATALALTARYGRAALLAHYLRLAPYGNGSHGIGHAARFYFDKPASDLSWAEIALLSALPQSPTRLNPMRPQGLSLARRRGARALDELARQRLLGGPELELARLQLKTLAPQPRQPQPDAPALALRYQAALREAPPQPGAEPRIRTTIDLVAQRRLAARARRALAAFRGADAQQVAAMIVERGSGRVRAVVGSDLWRGEPGGALDFTRTPRSPGSTLKPFIYALALQRGVVRPGDLLADLPEEAAGVANADGHFLGPMLPRQALANSRNVPAIDLLRRTGLEETLRVLRRLGLADEEAAADRLGVGLALGAMPTTLERLVRAYGALADDGRLGELMWFEDRPRPPPTRVFSEDAARLVVSFLSDPLARLPSFPRYGPLEYPFPAAVKTGTSQGYRDALTVAFTRDYVVGAWLGRPDAGTMTRLTGANSAARLVRAALIELHGTSPGDIDDAGFPPPAGRRPIELCLFDGRSQAFAPGCGQTLTEFLRPDEIPADSKAAPARHRAWALELGYRIAAPAPAPFATAGDVRLSILSPRADLRVWRNPDAPPALARIALRVEADPKPEQVVWYVDGAPFALADPDAPLHWPLQKGAHRFQVRLPLRPGASKVVSITVE